MTLTCSPIFLAVIITAQGFLLACYIFKSYSSDLFESPSRVWKYSKKTDIVNEGYDYDQILKSADEHHSARFSNTIISQSKVEKETTTGHRVVNDEPYLFVAIISGISFLERRNAVRNSWMKDCIPSRRVICKFFTDGLNVKGAPLPNSTLRNLQKESEQHNSDLVILDGPSGRNFATRLLNAMEWASANVEFDFFLRVDDDHYICLDRLLKELPYRPRERLYWGHIHCVPSVVRIDEGWVMLTEDIVRSILKTKNNLLCSRFADQSLAMWIYDLMKKKAITWYGDERIFHHPPSSTINEFKIRKEICHTYLSLHGSYPIEQRVFRLIDEHERQTYGDFYDIPPVIDVCPYAKESFNWKWFDPTYYTVPLPCKDKPIWSDGGEVFLGRSIDIREKMSRDRANEARWIEMHKKEQSISPKQPQVKSTT